MWFKVNDKILDASNKMARFQNADWGRWVKILALGSKSPIRGKLMLGEKIPMNIDDIARVFGDTIDETFATLKILKVLKMLAFFERNSKIFGTIQIVNWDEYQGSSAPDKVAERVKRFRLSQKEAIDETEAKQECNEDVTSLKRPREEKRREEKREREEGEEHTQNYLTTILEDDLKEFSAKFNCSPAQIAGKAEDLLNYCRAKGRVYKNYKAFLRNALKKDFGDRPAEKPKEKLPELSKEQIIKNQEALKEMRAGVLKSMPMAEEPI